MTCLDAFVMDGAGGPLLQSHRQQGVGVTVTKHSYCATDKARRSFFPKA